jgi:transcriptional regulator, TetR family
MDEIAGELGISKKTLYKYFGSKNQLISEIVDRIVEVEKRTFLAEIEKGSTWQKKLGAMLTLYTPDDFPFKLLDELYRYFPGEKEKIQELGEFRRAIILPLLQQGQKCGEIRTDLNPAIIWLVIHNIFLTPADPEILETQDITVKQLLEQMKNLFFYGILEIPGGRI